MSMQPYWNWYQNSNNIIIVPSTIEHVNNTATNIGLPITGQQEAKNYVLPGIQDNKCAINYGNVHFNGCVDTSNYVCNPYIPPAIKTQHEVIYPSCSEYNCPNNLVNITGFNSLTNNPSTSYSTWTESIEHDKKVPNYDYTNIEFYNKPIYSHHRNTGFDIVDPGTYTHQLNNNLVMIPRSNDLSVDKMSAYTTSKVINKYNKYKDLRNVIKERYTNSYDESNNTGNNKNKEDCISRQDLKHLLRCRTERIEKRRNTKKDKRELESKSDINEAAKKSLGKLSKTISKSTHKLERNYQRILISDFQEKPKPNPGLLERKSLSKVNKSKLSPDALKRYLAYQRFLRSCYKSLSPSPQKILKLNKDNKSNDNNRLRINKKISKHLGHKEKSEADAITSTNKTDQRKTINKPKKIVSNHIVRNKKRAEASLNATKYVDNKLKKGETNINTASYLDEKVKRSEPKVRVTSSKDQTKKKGEPRVKIASNENQIRKRDHINEKVARYSEKKRKRLESKEQLNSNLDKKKDKIGSETKLDKHLKQNKIYSIELTDESITTNRCKLANKSDDKIDLRSVLTRKRTKSHSHKESKRIKTTTSEHKNVKITVKQEENTKAEPPKVTVNKVKPKRNKRIKLVINIVCPNSTYPDNSDQTTKDRSPSPHQEDLSFLDDFNVDEIVESLNVSSQSPICENNITSKEDCHDGNVDTNEFYTTQIESIKKITEDKSPLTHDDLHMQKEELNTAVIAEESNSKEVNNQTEIDANEQNNFTQLDNEDKSKHEQSINICENQELELHMQKEELNTALIAEKSNSKEVNNQTEIGANEQNDSTQLDNVDISKNEQSINICESQELDTISTKKYCDDIYEVIDITEDTGEGVNSDVIILQEIINLDSNDHHENIELLSASSKKYTEETENIIETSDRIMQNKEMGDDLKDKTKISNEIDATTDFVTQTIEPSKVIHEKEITNDMEINIAAEQNQQNIVDIENGNTVTKRTALLEIKEPTNQNIITSEILTVGDNDNIESIGAKDLNARKQSNMKIKHSVISHDIIDCHKVSNYETESSQKLALQNTLDNIPKENQDNVPPIEYFNEDMNRGNDKKSKRENTSNFEQSHTVQKKIGDDSAINKANIIETKSDLIKSPIKSLSKHLLNVTAVTNDTNAANVKILKLSHELNNENIENTKIKPNSNGNTQSNKVDKVSKTRQLKVNSKDKFISNVDNIEMINASATVKNKTLRYKINMELDQTNSIDETISPSLNNLYIKDLEQRMLEYLKVKITITTLVHHGYFSNVYKCRDPVGESYALKVVKTKYRSASICKDKMLTNLQKSTSGDNSFIIKLIECFNFSGEWCFLTDYYPKTLEEALVENGKCFHIDLVQILARQLVAAVTTLTNNEIIHADIKPSHILLNSTNDKLKLCSFDRSNYNYDKHIIPSSGTASYRAPEIILGYDADYRIDVWATALVMYEMATGIRLFPGRFNNDILYKQLCTLGALDYEMLKQCRLRHVHFMDTQFKRQLGNEKWVFVKFYGINNKLRHKLFSSYNRDWRPNRTQWQITEDLDKIEMLFKLLEQMLILNPRHRLPITFVGANEFIYDNMSDMP